jgi:hypothetical protein
MRAFPKLTERQQRRSGMSDDRIQAERSGMSDDRIQAERSGMSDDRIQAERSGMSDDRIQAERSGMSDDRIQAERSGMSDDRIQPKGPSLASGILGSAAGLFLGLCWGLVCAIPAAVYIGADPYVTFFVCIGLGAILGFPLGLRAGSPSQKTPS